MSTLEGRRNVRNLIEPVVLIQGKGHPGFNGGGAAEGSQQGGSSNLSDQLVNAMLKHRANVPLLDSILKEVGLEHMDPRSIIDGKVFDKAESGKTVEAHGVVAEAEEGDR